MNIIAQVQLANGRTIESCRAVYYSATDHTVVWEWRNGADVALLDHPGTPVPKLDGDGLQVTFRGTKGVKPVWQAPAPQDGVTVQNDAGVATYVESGCGCSHAYKRYAPPDPQATGAAWREHAR